MRVSQSVRHGPIHVSLFVCAHPTSCSRTIKKCFAPVFTVHSCVENICRTSAAIADSLETHPPMGPELRTPATKRGVSYCGQRTEVQCADGFAMPFALFKLGGHIFPGFLRLVSREPRQVWVSIALVALAASLSANKATESSTLRRA